VPSLGPVEPIAKSHSDLLDAFHPPYAGGQVSAEETRIRSLVRKPAHCTQSQIDSARRKFTCFEVNPVPHYNGSVKGEPRFGAVPFHKLVNREPVSALSIGRRQAVYDRGFGLI